MVASKHWSEIYSTFMLFLTRALIKANYKEIVSVDVCLHDLTYRKVAISRLSWLVAHFHIFRLFMKEKFDAYVL